MCADDSGELLLVFTQISSQEPSREFVLGVRVPDSNVFEGACPGISVLCSFCCTTEALVNVNLPVSQ